MTATAAKPLPAGDVVYRINAGNWQPVVLCCVVGGWGGVGAATGVRVASKGDVPVWRRL